MNADLLPWNQGLWRSLIDRVNSGAIAHAFLLKGMPGMGKGSFAKDFAAWLLCDAPKQDVRCLMCKGCALVNAGSHPDLFIVEPEESGRAIKVDQIRKLNEFSHKTAQQGGRRIIILNPAEAMNINASNALLKCLEEPGEGTFFFLISHRPGDIVPTIRSRCQSLDFKVPANNVAMNWLFERIDSNIDVKCLLRLSYGSPLLAVIMFERGVIEQHTALIKSVGCLFRGELTPVELGKQWQGEQLQLVFSWLADWMVDITRFALAGDKYQVPNADLLKLVTYVACKSDIKLVIKLRSWLLKQRHILVEGGNLNTQLLAEGVFCRFLDLVI